MFEHIDWNRPSICPQGWWLHQEQEAKTPDGNLEFVVTIPPLAKDSTPMRERPVLVFLTGSACDHLQLTSQAKKCPPEKYVRRPGMRICLYNYVIVSVSWAKSKKKGFNTGPPQELYLALDEIKAIFPDRQKRLVVGFSRGAMGAVETQYYRSDFAALHVLIAPYYPSHLERLQPCEFIQKYVETKTEVYIYYGQRDQWREQVDIFLNHFRNNYKMKEYLLYDVEIPGKDHDESFEYIVQNPGQLWKDLERRFAKLEQHFERQREQGAHF